VSANREQAENTESGESMPRIRREDVGVVSMLKLFATVGGAIMLAGTLAAPWLKAQITEAISTSEERTRGSYVSREEFRSLQNRIDSEWARRLDSIENELKETRRRTDKVLIKLGVQP